PLMSITHPAASQHESSSVHRAASPTSYSTCWLAARWRNRSKHAKRHAVKRLIQTYRHRLPLGVGVEAAFAEFAADAAHLEAAEGGGSVEDVVAVDPNGAGLDFRGQQVGLGDVARPDSGR